MARRIISWRELAKRMADASVSTAKRLEKIDPDFPQKVEVSPGRVGFFEDEIDNYIARRPRVEKHKRSRKVEVSGRLGDEADKHVSRRERVA